MKTRQKQKALPMGVVTAMFTDMENSTPLKGLMEGETSARRDAKYREEIKEPHDKLLRAAVQASGGRMKDSSGDSFCFLFADAEEAVRCALQIQRELTLTP